MTGSLGSQYKTTFIILATVTVLGIVWELIYHFLQQFRWEKDWPTLIAFLNMFNEGIVVWVLLHFDLVPFIDGPNVPLPAFVIMFVVVWIAQWLTANGPMRV